MTLNLHPWLIYIKVKGISFHILVVSSEIFNTATELLVKHGLMVPSSGDKYVVVFETIQ